LSRSSLISVVIVLQKAAPAAAKTVQRMPLKVKVKKMIL